MHSSSSGTGTAGGAGTAGCSPLASARRVFGPARCVAVSLGVGGDRGPQSGQQERFCPWLHWRRIHQHHHAGALPGVNGLIS